MAISKIILNGITQMDLTSDTVAANNLISPNTAHGADGEPVVGTASGGIVITDVTNTTGTGAAITADTIGTLITKSITQNGTYAASSDNADGFSSVTVNVSGGTPSATQHTIYFEFSDSTDTTITAYYDDAFISNAITATTPTTYGQKAVTLAQLDGVTWYNPSDIPLNTQLIDFTAVVNNYHINGTDGTEYSNPGSCCSDYTMVDPTMTFTFIGYRWFDLAFYTANKTFISGVMQENYADSIDENDLAHGTLSGSRIPSNAMYVRLSSYPGEPDSSRLSLIRTA